MAEENHEATEQVKTPEQYAEEFSKKVDNLIERAAAIDQRNRTDVDSPNWWQSGIGVGYNPNAAHYTDEGLVGDHLYVVEKKYYNSTPTEEDSVSVIRWRKRTEPDDTSGDKTGNFEFRIVDRETPHHDTSYFIDGNHLRAKAPVEGGLKGAASGVENIISHLEKGVAEAEARQATATTKAV